MKRRRWRTAVLAIGCTSCVLIAVAFVASGWWFITFQTQKARGRDTRYFREHQGPVLFLNSGSARLWSNSVSIFSSPGSAASSGTYDSVPFALRHPFNLLNWNSGIALSRRASAGQPGFFVQFPPWLPFLAVAVPTLLAWRF